ncbi:MAG: UbiX family flavin prenyltransferase [Bdellovibrionales bacterium]|nr:UbiX family flavin prenyltransferase [Bdellovibrionales bacterium]
MSQNHSHGIWVLGVTGASGMPYALRTLDILSRECKEVHVCFSEAALRVLFEEHGIKISFSALSCEALLGEDRHNVFFYNNRDIGAKIASGSFLFEGMIVAPLSMGSLGAIAHGFGTTLIHRAADVTIKEGRRLILVPRESPLSEIHLENLLKLSRLGARIVPPMPAFYQQPATISDLVDGVTMKILDSAGINVPLLPRWGEEVLLPHNRTPSPDTRSLSFECVMLKRG